MQVSFSDLSYGTLRVGEKSSGTHRKIFLGLFSWSADGDSNNFIATGNYMIIFATLHSSSIYLLIRGQTVA